MARIATRATAQHLPAALLTFTLLLAGCAGGPPKAPPAPVPDDPYAQLINQVEAQHGPIAAARVRYWFQLIEQGKTQDDHARLLLANNFFNDAKFVTDEEVWQQSDYWATPLEFLIKDAGDCEDFSIAKYVTLDRMGLDTEKMRITYVKALTLDQPHMVLAYYTTPAGEPLILDNINPQILPAGQRQDLIPVYSFNGNTLWLARSRNEQVPSGDAQQLGLWQKLMQRMQQEMPAASR